MHGAGQAEAHGRESPPSGEDPRHPSATGRRVGPRVGLPGYALTRTAPRDAVAAARRAGPCAGVRGREETAVSTGLAQAHGRVPPRAQVHGLDPPARRCRARILPGAGARPGRPRAQVQGRVPPRAQVHGPDPPERRCTAGSSCVQVHGRVPPRAQARGRVPPHPGRRRAAGSPPGRRRAAGSSRAQVHGRVPARAQARSRVSPRAQVHGPDHPARRFTAWILPGAGAQQGPRGRRCV